MLKLPVGLLALLLTPSIVTAQATDLPITSVPSGWTVARWTSDEGLPQNSVVDIVQTADGYVWLATFGGLVRFDGDRFTTFSPVNTQGLPLTRITALYETRQGDLWVGSERWGVSRHRGGRFEHVITGPQVVGSVVRGFTEDADGTVWIATDVGLGEYTSDGGFRLHDAEDFQTPYFWAAHPGVAGVLAAADGTLWLIVRGRLFRRQDATWAPVLDTPFRFVSSLIADSTGHVHAVSVTGAAYRWDGGRWREELTAAPGTEAVGGAMLITPHGRWFLRGATAGFIAAGVDREEVMLEARFPLRKLMQDREGGVWIGTNGEGVFRFRRRTIERIRHFDLPAGTGQPTTPPTSGIVGDGRGGLWVLAGCPGAILHRSAAGSWRALPVRRRADDFLYCGLGLHRDPGAAVLWVAHGNRLGRVEDGRFHEGPEIADAGQSVYSVLRGREGSLWVGHQRGLLRILPDRGTERHEVRTGLPAGEVRALHEDAAGTLWVGTSAGVARIANGASQVLTEADGLSGGEVRTFHERPDGTMWIGTYGGGLSRWRDGQLTRITTKTGLFEDIVSAILPDDDGNLWLNGNKALSVLSLAALDSAADGLTDRLFPVTFQADDGYAEGNYGSPGAWRDPRGRLWFASIDGLMMVDPGTRHLSNPPPVLIESVTVGDSVLQATTGAVEIPPGRPRVEVRYAVLSFDRPDQVRVRYRLGQQDAWIDALGRRSVVLSGLGPGRYDFEAQAATADGVWNLEGASVSLIVLPPWWATWWARGLVVVLLAGGLAGGVRAREAAIRRRNVELDREVHDRRLAEERARMSEARLQAVVRAAPVILFALDAEGTFTFSDGRGLEALGLKPGERVGQSALDLYAGNAAMVENLRAGLTGKRRTWRVDVGDLVFDVRTLPLRDATGAVVGLTGVATDVTAEVQASQAFAESEGRFRSFIEHAQDMIIVLDDAGRLEYLSPSTVRLLGWDPDQLAGRELLEFVHADDRSTVEAAFLPAAPDPGGRRSQMLRLRTAGGTYLTVDGVASAYMVEGKGMRIIVNARDVSDRLAAEKERDRLNEELRRTQRLEAIGQLAGGIAHDFNNLLTVIGVNVSLAGDAEDAADISQSLEEIRSAQRTAASLTRQLLAFGRRQILKPEVVDLNEVIEGVHALVRRILGEHVRVERSLSEGCFVYADPGQIEQIVLNLLVNARDAMPEGGTVLVRTRRRAPTTPGPAPADTPGTVELLVRDTGTGMDQETVDRIFEPFFTTKQRGRGTGLGLATVFGIVRQSGGTIRVESRPGHGSTFIIQLPEAHEAAEGSVPGQYDTSVPRGTETILVAEDDPSVRRLLVSILQRLGYTVIAAPDGVAAEQAAEEHGGPIDLLITDMVMPRQGGDQLARSMQRSYPDLPVLFITGYAERLLSGDDGSGPILMKPFDVPDLGRTVRGVLDGTVDAGV